MKTRARAALFAPHLSSLGGTEKCAAFLAQALEERGWAVDLLADRALGRGALNRAFGTTLKRARTLAVETSGRGGGREAASRTSRYGLFVNLSSAKSFPSFARRSWLWAHYLPKRPPTHLGFYELLCNSRFTRKRIRERWGADARVVHPPVDFGAFRPRRKEKIVLTAGRLQSDPAPARELELVRRFARLARSGKLPGWSYHIAGRGGSPAWLRKLRAASRDLPVHVHADLAFPRVAALFGRASILWHATGFGDEARPELLEHFGLAVAEAMASGCVPVAYAAGGPAELIRSGKDGFLFRSWEGLERRTLELARGCASMSRRTRAAVRRYGLDRFRKAVDGLLR